MVTQGERNKQAFVEGVRLLMSSWTVLKLAVDNEFGGTKSREKADWLVDTVIESFDKSQFKLFSLPYSLILPFPFPFLSFLFFSFLFLFLFVFFPFRFLFTLTRSSLISREGR